MEREEKRRELLRIRNKFQASRKQFGEIFVGKSEPAINFYDRGKVEVPDSVLRLAYIWESFLDRMSGEIQCKK